MKNITDSFAISDSALIDNILAMTDSFAISDSVSSVIASDISISDSLSLFDTLVTEIYIPIAISDSIGFTDLLYFRKAFVALDILTPIVTQIDISGEIVKIINIDAPIGG